MSNNKQIPQICWLEQTNTPTGVPLSQMFRFADKYDKFMIILGMIGSLGTGASLIISNYFVTKFDNSYTYSDNSMKQSDGFQNMMGAIYLGIAALVFGWIMIAMWVITGQRQASKCKKSYYESLLKQDAEFFDCNQQSFINSQFNLDTDYFQNAIGEKIGLVLQIFGNFVTALAFSFWQGWLMTLVMIGTLILVFLSASMNMKNLKNKENKFLELYSRAGGRADEAISSIKTVKQFNAEMHESNLYQKYLSGGANEKKCSIVKIAVTLGLLNAFTFMTYSFGFWFGGNCLAGTNVCLVNLTGHAYTAENVNIVFFGLLLCLLELSLIVPALKQITLGREAAQRIFRVIDRTPKINIEAHGIKVDNFRGRVQFRNVTFAYPKNKDRQILKGLSISFNLNSSALVGESGCGKSTIAQLLMRLYDPDEGEILIDGQNIKEFDLTWLRSKIGYVGQEPVLFAATIRENLLYANPTASEEDMKTALRQAEVYDFVYQHLEKTIDTYVGVGGSQISGGQKQRIAIARALIKKPTILILDEATSALDRTNQKLIQETLNKISKTLTTITIAHRIGTIMSCSQIYILKEGKLQETGKFEELKYFKSMHVVQQNQNGLDIDSIVIQSQEFLKQQNISTNLRIDSKLELSNVELNNTIDENLAASRKYIMEQSTQQPKSQELIQYQESIYSRIFSFNRNKKLLFAFAILTSIGQGLLFPIFSIFIAEVYLEVLNDQNILSDTSPSDINASSLKFLYTAIVSFFIYFLQTMSGEIVGDEIASNLRMDTYNKILKMPMEWFDKRENTCGAISSKLSVDCEKVKDLLTTYIFIIVRSITTIISGFVIMFVYQWKLSLAIVAFITVLIVCGLARSYFKTKLAKQADVIRRKTCGMIEESLINIRTVSSFNMQSCLIQRYDEELQAPSKSLIKIGAITGVMNSISLFIVVSVIPVTLYIGILILINDGASIINIMTPAFSFYLMALALSKNISFLPDAQGAKIAAVNIFSILDGEDEEQVQVKQKSKMLTEGFTSNIEFIDVSFKYTGRQQQVFDKLNLKINPGQKVALIGPSGCGKSTVMQLLLRFYEPTKGAILINGIDIKDFDLKYLRSHLGMVGQEPAVFHGSFRENIRYSSLNATEEDIRLAAQKANALNFIADNNPECDNQAETAGKGFDREVGVKGFHISGGQKQRIAIARVILRDPRVMLLDEATSALDAENEREVQASLDKLMVGRTIITVAHRIETIKNSDVIYVFEKGAIVEEGTYQELKMKQGVFSQLEKGEKNDGSINKIN